MKSIYKLLIPLLLIFIFPAPVKADNLSLSLTPPLLELMIKPGRTVTQNFKLTNSGEDTLINFQILPFKDTGPVLDNLADSVPWIEVISPKTGFVLKKGETSEVVLKISPPQNIRERDFYQALLFKTTPVPQGRYSQSSAQGSLSALIFTSVTAQGLPKKAEIVSFDLPAIMDSFAPLNIDIRLKNTGETFFHPNGKIILKGALGEVSFPIIPTLFMADQERPLLIDYSPAKGFSGFFLGRYTVKASFILDDGTIKVERQKIIYCLPYKLFALLSSLGIIVVINKKRKKRKL